MDTGAKGTQPAAGPIHPKLTTAQRLQRASGLEAPVGVLAPERGRAGPDPQKHRAIEAHLAGKGQGLQRKLADAAEGASQGLGPLARAEGQLQIREGQTLRHPVVGARTTLQAKGTVAPLQRHGRGHPLAIQPGREHPNGPRIQGPHHQAAAACGIAIPITHPGFIQGQGASSGLGQPQLEIGGEVMERAVHPAFGRQHPLQGSTHQRR